MKLVKNGITFLVIIGVVVLIAVSSAGASQGKSIYDYLPTLSISNTATPEPAPSSTTTLTPTVTATIRPSDTPAPTPTQEPLPEEPTLAFDTDVIGDDFALVRIDLDNIKFLSKKTIVVYTVVEGQETATSLEVYSSSVGSSCQEVSLLDNVKRVYQEVKKQGVDWHTMANGIMGESQFAQFVDDGNGGCKLLQNYEGHPAWCMTQIYLPSHKRVTVEQLKDTNFCIQYGVGVFADFSRQYPGDPVQAMACYKGFCQKNYQGKDSPGFINHFMESYNTSGIEVDGHYIPFDENKLLEMYPDWKVN